MNGWHRVYPGSGIDSNFLRPRKDTGATGSAIAVKSIGNQRGSSEQADSAGKKDFAEQVAVPNALYIQAASSASISEGEPLPLAQERAEGGALHVNAENNSVVIDRNGVYVFHWIVLCSGGMIRLESLDGKTVYASSGGKDHPVIGSTYATLMAGDEVVLRNRGANALQLQQAQSAEGTPYPLSMTIYRL